MKIFLCFIFLTFNNLNNIDDYISVFPNFTDKELLAVESRVKKEYGVDVKINVLKRDENGTIIHLKFIRYFENKTQAASCESDDFKVLKITLTGCTISDNVKKHLDG